MKLLQEEKNYIVALYKIYGKLEACDLFCPMSVHELTHILHQK